MTFSSLRRPSLVPAALALASALLLPVAAAPTAAAAGTYTLITFPDAGHTPVYNFISSATKSVDVTLYELNDTTAENALIADARRGVNVRVILDGKQTTTNGPAYQYLNANGVPTVWSSQQYYYTHQKSIAVDGVSAYISTGNLDTTWYADDRDYAVIDNDPVDVTAIEQVFNADFIGASITPSDGNHLVWSPTDSQTQLLNLINSATKSLDLEQLEMGFDPITNALADAARRGVAVKITMTDQSWGYEPAWQTLVAAGAQVHTFANSPGTTYIHAKVIEVDYGTPAARVFVGSENFSNTSLNSNRELGLIINDSAVLTSIQNTTAKDFAAAPAWTSGA